MNLTSEQMREMLKFAVDFDLERANRKVDVTVRPKRITKLIARKLCPHARLETIDLTQNRLRIRCIDCGATAIHREKR